MIILIGSQEGGDVAKSIFPLQSALILIMILILKYQTIEALPVVTKNCI
jgi:hypothetical protein